MKFSWIIFIYTYTIMVVSFGIGGFLIIEAAFENNIRSRRDGLVESNQYLMESYAAMINIDERLETNMAGTYRSNVIREDEDSRVFIGISSQMTNYGVMFDEQMKSGKRMVRITMKEGQPFLQVVSVVDAFTNLSYVENLENVSEIYRNRDENYRQFQIILLVVSAVSGLLLLLIAKHLTDPLKKLSRTAREIGNGSFEKRVKVEKMGSSAEIRSLTEDFNLMAGYVETYIEELKEENRRREEFVGNFTHELKTPLTSVIGYADLLRSYEFDSEKRRRFAEYIYREGKRMETLALHLLELIVLKKQHFDLAPVNTEYFFHEVRETLVFVMEKYHAKLHMDCEPCRVLMEEDLLKTLVYNLVDNGCKAMVDNGSSGKASDIYIRGRLLHQHYQITVRDTGVGIPEEEIRKITEAFYMIDKSRAQTMGGAGLGLTLCREIAGIHGSELEIESRQGEGTSICVCLTVEGEKK